VYCHCEHVHFVQCRLREAISHFRLLRRFPPRNDSYNGIFLRPYPAALSIMISYFFQVTLSSRLRYKSLYEAQVPTRDESPAHYLGEIQNALPLLGEHRFSLSNTVGHLELQELLTSGIAIDLSGGKQLTIGVLRSDSPCVSKPVKSDCLNLGDEDVHMVAILRENKVLLPHPEMVLQSGHRLMMITSPNA